MPRSSVTVSVVDREALVVELAVRRPEREVGGLQHRLVEERVAGREDEWAVEAAGDLADGIVLRERPGHAVELASLERHRPSEPFALLLDLVEPASRDRVALDDRVEEQLVRDVRLEDPGRRRQLLEARERLVERGGVVGEVRSHPVAPVGVRDAVDEDLAAVAGDRVRGCTARQLHPLILRHRPRRDRHEHGLRAQLDQQSLRLARHERDRHAVPELRDDDRRRLWVGRLEPERLRRVDERAVEVAGDEGAHWASPAAASLNGLMSPTQL